MNPPSRAVDKDGFPIPPTFEDPHPSPPERSRRHVTIVRALLVLAGVVLVGGVAVKSLGREYIASWYLKRAEQSYHRDDLPAAVANADQAQSWLPDSPEIYYFRAHYRERAKDLPGSLEDYNKLIEMRPSFASAYSGRSVVYQRLQRHREAIDDVSKAIQLRPRNDHNLLNHRAYARAIAKLELTEALEDIQRAIDMAPGEQAAYLDTRGYLYHLLDRQDEALVDLDRAVQLTVAERKRDLEAIESNLSEAEAKRRQRQYREHEAVMVYHRGLVHEKLGNTEQAQADLEHGKKLGYDPAEGVY